MKLHEIELYSNNPDEAKNFYSSVLGLKLNVDEPDLKVFNAGINGVDLNISKHNSVNKVSLSFLVKDVNTFIEMMKEKQVELDEPYDSHLGMRAITLTDNDGCRIVIHSPTDASPKWLRDMV